MSDIRVERSAAAAIVYEVLARVDLGADAANLLLRGRPPTPWAEDLRAAYDRAPGRLHVHAIGLRVDGIDTLVASLRAGAPGLTDEAGLGLGHALADAIDELRPGFTTAFEADAERFAARREIFARDAVPVLARLRAALVETTGAPPPPLVVLDCPALGPAGRATTRGEARIVAVSLAMPAPHPLLQVLHEEIHPITDPLFVADRKLARGRDTRAGTAGHALHRDLELAAIEVGEALVAARAPELQAAYRSWRARLRI